MNDQSNLPAVQRTERRFISVVDPVAIFDTAKFEHFARIANLMAASSMIPDHLRGSSEGSGQNRKFTPYEPEVVRANCFMIVNQADRWNADPFAVAACTSFVHGKMMYEGKLIAAVLEANSGIELEYEFVEPSADQPRQLKVIVSAVQDGKPLVNTKGKRLEIEGTVDQWHTGDKGAWNKQSDWKRQLRYRGGREWTRAYRPALMLGVIAPDEIDELREEMRAFNAQPTGPDSAIARLARAGGAPADVVAHVARETEPDAPSQRASSEAKPKEENKPKGEETAGARNPAQAQDGASVGEGGTAPATDAAPGPSIQEKGAEATTTEVASAAEQSAANDDQAAAKQDEQQAASAGEPEWMADLTEDQRIIYDRAMDGLHKVTAKSWVKFRSAYRSEMKPVIDGMPQEAQEHIEATMTQRREELGI